MNKNPISVFGAAAIAALCGSLCGTASAQQSLVIAYTGQTVPGETDTFATLGTPVVGNLGQFAFQATTAGGDDGIWGLTSVGQDINAFVVSGSTAPGGAGHFMSFSDPLVDANGGIAFTADTDAAASGVWASGNAALELIALTETPAPGAGGNNFWLFTDLVYNDLGQIAFQAILRDNANMFTTVNDRAVYTNGPLSSAGAGTLGLAAIEGAVPVAGISPYDFFFQGLSINNQGDMAFGAGTTDSADIAVVSGPISSQNLSGGLLSPVVASTTVTIGFDFASIETPRMNSNGHFAFVGALFVGIGGATTNDDTIVWATGPMNAGAPGAIRAVAREGDAAPGDARTFTAFGTPVIAENNSVAFRATLSDGSTGLYLSTGPGNLTAIVTPGDAAPGANAAFATVGEPALAGNGDMVFTASLAMGGDVTPANMQGVWAYTANTGSISLIQRTGDMVDVDNMGTMKTIAGITMFSGTGGGDGRRSPISDFGVLAVHAAMTDGSEAIILNALGDQCSGLDIASPFGAIDARDIFLILAFDAQGGDVSQFTGLSAFNTTAGGEADLDFFELLAILEDLESAAPTLECPLLR